MEAWKGECVSSAYTISFTPAMLVDRDRQSNLLDMTKMDVMSDGYFYIFQWNSKPLLALKIHLYTS